MARGGRRQGKPGKAYTNRTDMNTNRMPVQSAPSAQYGERAKLDASQQAVPMGSAPEAAPPTGPAPPVPGASGDFRRPTERPDEPFTTGLPMGPGAGPEALGAMAQPDEVTLQLRALYSKYPLAEIAELLDEME